MAHVRFVSPPAVYSASRLRHDFNHEWVSGGMPYWRWIISSIWASFSLLAKHFASPTANTPDHCAEQDLCEIWCEKEIYFSYLIYFPNIPDFSSSMSTIHVYLWICAITARHCFERAFTKYHYSDVIISEECDVPMMTPAAFWAVGEFPGIKICVLLSPRRKFHIF